MKTVVLLYDTSCIYEIVKQLELFEDEADLQETIAFWREFRRIE